MTKCSLRLAVKGSAAGTAGNVQKAKIIKFPEKRKARAKRAKISRTDASSNPGSNRNSLDMYFRETRSGKCGRVSYAEFDDMARRVAFFRGKVLCYAKELIFGQSYGENCQQYAAFVAVFGEPEGTYGPTNWLRAKIISREMASFFGFFNMPEAVRLAHGMCNANLALVINIAKHTKAYQQGHASLEDLIQAGNIGLMEAVARYDPKKGFRFSTYATWWIKHEINRSFINTGRRIRVPVHTDDAYKKLIALALQESMDLENDRTNSIRRLAAMTGWKESKVETVLTQVANVRALASLDSVPERGDSLMDVIADETVERPDESMEREEYIKTVLVLAKSEMEKKYPIGWAVLCLRFGLEGNREHILQEIADLRGLTRERIRQIETKALEKIRVMKKLRALLG